MIHSILYFEENCIKIFEKSELQNGSRQHNVFLHNFYHKSLFDDGQIMRTYAKDIEMERKAAGRMIRKGKRTLEEIASENCKYIIVITLAVKNKKVLENLLGGGIMQE